MEPQKLLDLIGNTPLMESVNLIKNKTKLLLKLEGNNPGGSLKDRAARNMMVSALERDIKKEQLRLPVETGIALAMIAQLLGIEIELILPEDSTKEHTNHACLWLTVILTP
jgi:cysteine synthase B